MPGSSKPITALIFDFGGVLMRTEDPEPRERMARKLGLSRQALEAIVFEGQLGEMAEVGAISSEERWRRVTHHLGLQSPDAWRTFASDFFAGEALDTELVDHIRSLHGKYKTALLSNASEILDRYVRHTLGLENAFDVIVVSALVGMKKPDPQIYLFTLGELNAAPEEAVFVDDWQQNVDAAAAVGMYAIQFTTRGTVLAQLDELLAIPR